MGLIARWAANWVFELAQLCTNCSAKFISRFFYFLLATDNPWVIATISAITCIFPVNILWTESFSTLCWKVFHLKRTFYGSQILRKWLDLLKIFSKNEFSPIPNTLYIELFASSFCFDTLYLHTILLPNFFKKFGTKLITFFLSSTT